jgi:hypothetical protein
MRVPHSAKRSLAALALAALMAGCGGDSNAPDEPFDPAGTSADVEAIEASFESEATIGFSAASVAIGDVLGQTAASAAVRAVPSKALLYWAKKRSGVDSVARVYAGDLMRRVNTSAAAIPEQYLGVTFTRDPETLEYGPSEVTGAPEDGVRFMVYAVNPISGVPITPLVEVGYADVHVTETTSSIAARVELVSSDITYLDYSVNVAATSSEATITVAGFVSNGDDRVDFDLDHHLSSNALVLDYNLTVPTRNGFRIDYEASINLSTFATTSTLEARGPHGTVTVTGTETTTGGSYEVEVNGELFATITTTPGEEPVITGADGQALTAEEQQALLAIYVVFYGGLDFFGGLLDPLQ